MCQRVAVEEGGNESLTLAFRELLGDDARLHLTAGLDVLERLASPASSECRRRRPQEGARWRRVRRRRRYGVKPMQAPNTPLRPLVVHRATCRTGHGRCIGARLFAL